MDRDQRLKLLSESLREANRKAQEERDYQAYVARVAKIARPEIDKLLAQYQAETSKPMSCPRCGEPLPESWRTDKTTSSVDNDDEDNVDDDDDRELDAKAKSRLVAEIAARKRKR
jgi:uncharacterized metal-binding protein YceD (DUF177 family)